MRSPFAEALGDDLERLPAPVRDHFAPRCGELRYRGVMKSVWRAKGVVRLLTGPFLLLGKWADTLFPETGGEIPFEIVNRLFTGPDGVVRMTFERTFWFPRVTRRFEASMRYDAETRGILDSLGRRGHLLVELHPEVEAGAMRVRSGRQWIAPFGGRFRVRLPRILGGEADIREWQEGEGRLGIRVSISNPLFGEFFGYEGSFERLEGNAWQAQSAAAGGMGRDATLSPSQRWKLALIPVVGTGLYAGSFQLLPVDSTLTRYGIRVAVSAAVSWLGFGAVLIAVRPQAGLWVWFDTCLRTMVLGNAVLGMGVILNGVVRLLGWGAVGGLFTGLHLMVLGLSDLVMGAYFVSQTRRHGLSPVISWLLWLAVLNGFFGLGAWLT